MSEEARIGAVVDDMYDMISGPAGPRDWSRQAAIFHPDARQMRTGVDDSGKAWINIMSLDEYAENTTPYFAANPFFEVEIGRRIDVFGNMAQVWSAYEARTALDDAEPERRGVNSIQLYRNESGRWQIISMIWDNERHGLQIPAF
jgi:hypothetical protein